MLVLHHRGLRAIMRWKDRMLYQMCEDSHGPNRICQKSVEPDQDNYLRILRTPNLKPVGLATVVIFQYSFLVSKY